MNVIQRWRFAIRLALLLILAQGLRVTAQTKASGSATATGAPQSLGVGNKRYDAEKELARLSKRYSLTDDQKTKIQPILVEQQKQVHELGEDQTLSDSEWTTVVRKVHLQTVVKVKLQMTDPQANKYAKDEAKRAKSDGGDQDDMDGPPDGPPPGGPPPGGGPGPGGPPGVTN